ncbi:MAG: polymer-forming cytoskeletal protein [Elusimicrobia bacterium]|nr:polymer-forming cytoskeletal protein [Elusimicrobiota bacterium]
MFDSKKLGRFDGNESMTLIGEEAYVHGQLAAKGSLRVEGAVEGDITDAVSVEIGKKGRVKGNVAAETVSVAGELEGDVVASRTVEILAAARLTGNIRTPNLRIEDGAIFEGTCAMRAEAAPAAAPAEAERSA